jgi:hypothetical protein
MSEFAATYASVELRDIPGAGEVSGHAPDTPLGLLPETVARVVIVRSLRHAAQSEAFTGWAERQQEAGLTQLRCTRDRLPTVGAVPLVSWLPFLAPV